MAARGAQFICAKRGGFQGRAPLAPPCSMTTRASPRAVSSQRGRHLRAARRGRRRERALPEPVEIRRPERLVGEDDDAGGARGPRQPDLFDHAAHVQTVGPDARPDGTARPGALARVADLDAEYAAVGAVRHRAYRVDAAAGDPLGPALEPEGEGLRFIRGDRRRDEQARPLAAGGAREAVDEGGEDLAPVARPLPGRPLGQLEPIAAGAEAGREAVEGGPRVVVLGPGIADEVEVQAV